MGANTPSGEPNDLTAAGIIYELMKILDDPEYVLDHPVEPRFQDDPWPILRRKIAVMKLQQLINRGER